LAERISILSVDDDISILSLIRETLELEGYEVLSAIDGTTALRLFKERPPSLVLLDIKLPDIDGYTICKHIRQASQVPIIMVTAKDREEEEAIGLEAGADDYITKPFSPLILCSHVRAALRRGHLMERQAPPSPFQYQDLAIDFSRQTVTIGGTRVKLSSTEYRILACLARQAGRVVHPGEIIREVWGAESEDGFNTLQVNISRLRIKLKGHSGETEYIETKPGRGYRLPAMYPADQQASIIQNLHH